MVNKNNKKQSSFLISDIKEIYFRLQIFYQDTGKSQFESIFFYFPGISTSSAHKQGNFVVTLSTESKQKIKNHMSCRSYLL